MNYKGDCVAAMRNGSIVMLRFWLTHSFLFVWLFQANSIGKNLNTSKGDNSATCYDMKHLFSFSFRGRMEVLKYVYFYAQKSIIKAGYNKFQDLINAPGTYMYM